MEAKKEKREAWQPPAISLKSNNGKDMQKNDIDKTGNVFEEAEKYLAKHYDFRYNTVSNSVEYRPKNAEKYEVLNENTIFRELQKNGKKISMASLNALLASDFVDEHDPIKEYFENLTKWDGYDHINHLASYVSTKNPKRFVYHLKKHLVRTVACAINDKFFNKHAFIIVGYTQNSGKSSYIRFYCPPALENYQTENFSIDKDGQIALSENFIINLDELATLDKQDINKLKSIFSRDRVKVRHPFGKKAMTTPRRASFFGSTNDQQFLTDETGSVRWLCFEIDRIDWDYSIKIDINKVWSQAYHLYNDKNFKPQLTPEDIAENEKENRKFQKSSPELEAIIKHLEPGNETNDFMTAFEVMELLKIYYPTSRFNHLKVGKVMTQLGFLRTIKRHEIDGKINPVYGYYVLRIPDF